MNINHLVVIITGLVISVIVVIMLFNFGELLPESPENNSWTPPEITPGVSLMNAPVLIHPEIVELKAGESKKLNITLETKENGPGEVHHTLLSRVEEINSNVKLPQPDG
ncbi:hypothetical protein [Methanoplanus limicola]|uniref:Uncharacterized protein n=1 Tax=Methanoplanus limicola DSM 2279 TaxID=937775 RepID=H1Z020_9EURY|nr:hypothetical protein [Methanoplanus limicola]EHQ35227.1 hypothetical protein Metlim_1116 [Methanoplanus limicola DSM 2279]